MNGAGGLRLSPRDAWLFASSASALGFVVSFRPEACQWGVVALWVASIVLWFVWLGLRRRGVPAALGFGWQDWMALVLLLTAFAAAWLPFATNWRWAFCGDSIAFFQLPYEAVTRGLDRSLLSVNGVYGHFTYTQALSWNVLMFLISPTLFWHRVGKLAASCLALAAIYVFFRLAVTRRTAVGVTIAVATTSVWLWFSYVSYAHIDSHLFAFGILSLALVVLRAPDRELAWAVTGLVAGISLFFTQTAWAEVGVVGLALTVLAFRTRRWRHFCLCGVSFVLGAAPVLLQLHDFIVSFDAKTRMLLTWPYLWHIFSAILIQPVRSGIFEQGAQGAFLRAPLDWLFPVGAAVALLAVVPAARRRLRVPAVAPFILGLFVLDAALISVTNNLYSEPSLKRTYHLIPHEAFLALLPLIVADAWARSRPLWSRLSAAVFVVVLAASATANLWLIAAPRPGTYGFNVFDGLIELRQQHADRTVVLFSSRPGFAQVVLGPDSFFQKEYDLARNVVVEPELTPARLSAALLSGAVVCYEPEFDEAAFATMRAGRPGRLVPFPVNNSAQMLCFESSSRGAGRPPI
jgi:hypothetical protein